MSIKHRHNYVRFLDLEVFLMKISLCLVFVIATFISNVVAMPAAPPFGYPPGNIDLNRFPKIAKSSKPWKEFFAYQLHSYSQQSNPKLQVALVHTFRQLLILERRFGNAENKEQMRESFDRLSRMLTYRIKALNHILRFRNTHPNTEVIKKTISMMNKIPTADPERQVDEALNNSYIANLPMDDMNIDDDVGDIDMTPHPDEEVRSNFGERFRPKDNEPDEDDSESVIDMEADDETIDDEPISHGRKTASLRYLADTLPTVKLSQNFDEIIDETGTRDKIQDDVEVPVLRSRARKSPKQVQRSSFE
jgi:hypothetical protein